MATSCSHYFRETIRGAEQSGLDSDYLLREVGLIREHVFDPNWRGDVELLARLVQLVWLALSDEFMGFMERPAKPGTFAMMTHCVINEDSLERALLKGIRFYDLFTDVLKMSLDIQGEEAALTIQFARPELDPQHYFLEFWLSIWYRLIGWMGGRLAPLKRATFSYPRPEAYIEEFKHMFPCSYTFDAPVTSLVFERKHLSLPISRTRKELKQFLSIAPLGFMMMPAEVKSYSRQVRNYLLRDRSLPLDFPELSDVAAHFNMTEQTLRRKLKLESASYRSLRENIRRDLAIQKLLKGNLPVSEIAVLVGYSETRAFTRAFAEWTGMSPLRYRESFRRIVGAKPAPT